MKKHWYYILDGNIRDDIGDNEYIFASPDWWLFPEAIEAQDSEGAIHEDDLFETRAEARKVAIEFHTKKVEEHEAKLFALMNEMLNEE